MNRKLTSLTRLPRRYRGLVKNTGQIVTLFALTNRCLARKRLLPCWERRARETGSSEKNLCVCPR